MIENLIPFQADLGGIAATLVACLAVGHRFNSALFCGELSTSNMQCVFVCSDGKQMAMVVK